MRLTNRSILWYKVSIIYFIVFFNPINESVCLERNIRTLTGRGGVNAIESDYLQPNLIILFRY